MIVFSSLQMRCGIRVLLNSVTASITPGQKVGLIGKNGCGKSTLFSLIKGDMQPEAGSITFPTTWSLAWVNQETPALKNPPLNM